MGSRSQRWGEFVCPSPIDVLHCSLWSALITTGTWTSARVLADRLQCVDLQRISHRFFPDHPRWGQRFLEHWRPDAALWTESDFWPNILSTARALAFLWPWSMVAFLRDLSLRWQWAPHMIKTILSIRYVWDKAQEMQTASSVGSCPRCYVGNLNTHPLLPSMKNS